MSKELQKHLQFDPQTGEVLPAESDFGSLAAELVAAARGQGIELTGPNGLLTDLTRQVLQSALEIEMSEHLGYDRHDPVGRNGLNSRNGSTPKTVRTDIGDVTVQIPRDRDGTFQPAAIPKHQRRLAGFDEAVISLYAKGMTTGDIVNHLQDVYGEEVSRDLVSKVTDQILADMADWQSRPLDAVYPVVLIDAIVLKIRAGQVSNRPVYVAMGISLDGHRDVLGMWIGPTGGEGAKQWMNMLTELRNRGGARRLHRVLRRLERPPRVDPGNLAGSDSANLRRAPGAQHLAVRVDQAVEADRGGPERDLPSPDPACGGSEVRGVRRTMATRVPGNGRDVAAQVARVRPVP